MCACARLGGRVSYGEQSLNSWNFYVKILIKGFEISVIIGIIYNYFERKYDKYTLMRLLCSKVFHRTTDN